MTVFSETTQPTEILQTGPFVGAEFIKTSECERLFSPYDNQHFADLYLADEKVIEASIAHAEQAFKITGKLSRYQRSEILKTIASLIKRDKKSIAEGITRESGKPMTTALAEVDRSIFTFQVAAEEALRIQGALIALDWAPGCEGRHAEIRRVAKGLVTGITPFNFPLNLVAHKVAPALAAGNPIIIKPSTQTALTAIKLATLAVEAGWPEDAIAVVPCSNDIARPLIEDERIKHLSFTGSPQVGWTLKSMAGKKAVTLELGGNAGNIIEPDVNLEKALDRIVWGGYVNAGQACISVQRLYLHESIYQQAIKDLVRKVKALKFGNPWLKETEVGPVINARAADRIEKCIQDALADGATLLAGGKRDGLMIEPTLIACDNEELSLLKEEVFGPVIAISSYANYEAALDRVSKSDFGLQAGVFTHDRNKIEQAIDRLEVGGVNINDVSTFRIDHMPYGGIKDSGIGREGLKYAIEEMTEMKLVTYNNAF